MKEFREFSNPVKTIEFANDNLGFFGILRNMIFLCGFLYFIYSLLQLITFTFNFSNIFYLVIVSLLCFSVHAQYLKSKQIFSINTEKKRIECRRGYTEKELLGNIEFHQIRFLAVFVIKKLFSYRYVVGMIYDDSKKTIAIGSGMFGSFFTSNQSLEKKLNDINIKAELAAEKLNCDFVSGTLTNQVLIPKDKYLILDNYNFLNKELNSIFSRKVIFYIYINIALAIMIILIVLLKTNVFTEQIKHLPNILGI